MPIQTDIWRIDGGLQKVKFTGIEAESKLEALLEEDIGLIDQGLMVLGRQVPTSFGKFVDLLAIDPEGQLVVVELKRNKTPREVVAQALDYASWVQSLGYDDVASIYLEKETSGHLEMAFAERFGRDMPETLNETHRMIVVASELDMSTERIINYLNSTYGVPINVVFLRYFKDSDHEYLSRTWLIDPALAESQSSTKGPARGKESWNGRDFYVSFGEGVHRSWEDARKYGFVSAGGGRWYTNTLSQLTPGARVFACIPGVGYVGVGTVKEPVVAAKDFMVDFNATAVPIFQAPLAAPGISHDSDDQDLSEYVVRVEWLKTLPAGKAIWEKGMFANQNSACKLRNKFTLERLAALFGLED